MYSFSCVCVCIHISIYIYIYIYIYSWTQKGNSERITPRMNLTFSLSLQTGYDHSCLRTITGTFPAPLPPSGPPQSTPFLNENTYWQKHTVSYTRSHARFGGYKSNTIQSYFTEQKKIENPNYCLSRILPFWEQ